MLKKPLNLRRVQVHKQRPMRPCRSHQIRHQLRRNRHAWPILAVLPRISVIRNHHRDPSRRRPLQRIDHDQQLHQVLVHRPAGGLHDENIRSAHVLQQLEVNLAIGEARHPGLTQRHADVLADILRQRAIGCAGENLETPVLIRYARTPRLRLRFSASISLSPPPDSAWPRPLLQSCPFITRSSRLVCMASCYTFAAMLLPGPLPHFGWATRIRTWTKCSKGT